MKILLTVLAVLGIVIAVLLLLVLLLLLIKVKVQIGYEDTFFLNLKVLFLKIKIFPSKKKKKEAVKKEVKAEEKKVEKKKPKKKTVLNEKLSELKFEDYLEMIDIVLRKFIAEIFVERFHVDVTVASDDAAKTALTYGRINGLVYPLAGFLNSRKKVKDMKISVAPDFSEEKPRYKGDLIIYVRVCHAVTTLIDLIKYIL